MKSKIILGFFITALGLISSHCAQSQTYSGCPTLQANVNATGYTLLPTDNCRLVSFLSSGNLTISLPPAGITYSPGKFETVLYPQGGGAITASALDDPNLGIKRFVNGGKSITFLLGQAVTVRLGTDSNWYAVPNGSLVANSITQLTGDVLAGPGGGPLASSIAAIQGVTVGGVTGTGEVVFSNSPTLTSPSANTLALTASTPSTSPTTGALTVVGGLGVGGAINTNGTLTTNNTTASTSTTTGAAVVAGGLGVGGAINAGALSSTPGFQIAGIGVAQGPMVTLVSTGPSSWAGPYRENGALLAVNTTPRSVSDAVFMAPQTVTGAVSSSGLIKLTTSTTGMTTGDWARVDNVGGTIEADGLWQITVVDSTHLTLQGSTFSNAYTSGGTVTDTLITSATAAFTSADYYRPVYAANLPIGTFVIPSTISATNAYLSFGPTASGSSQSMTIGANCAGLPEAIAYAAYNGYSLMVNGRQSQMPTGGSDNAFLLCPSGPLYIPPMRHGTVVFVGVDLSLVGTGWPSYQSYDGLVIDSTMGASITMPGTEIDYHGNGAAVRVRPLYAVPTDHAAYAVTDSVITLGVIAITPGGTGPATLILDTTNAPIEAQITALELNAAGLAPYSLEVLGTNGFIGYFRAIHSHGFTTAGLNDSASIKAIFDFTDFIADQANATNGIHLSGAKNSIYRIGRISPGGSFTMTTGAVFDNTSSGNTLIIGGNTATTACSMGTGANLVSIAGVIGCGVASTSTATGDLVTKGGLGVGGAVSAASGNFITGATNNLKACQASDNTTYNLLTFNATCTQAAGVGFVAGGGTDPNIYVTNGGLTSEFTQTSFKPISDNAIALGAAAQRWSDLRVVLASNTGAQTGYVCYNTTGGAFTYDGTNTCLVSSLRFKADVETVQDPLSLVMAMPRTISFRYKAGVGTLGPRYGQAAEEMANRVPRLVTHDKQGRPLAIDYEEEIPLLVGAIQQQQREIEELRRRLH